MELDFKFRPKNKYEILVLILFFTLALLEWIPEINSIGFIVFFGSLLLLMFFWLIDIFKKKEIYKKELTAIFLISTILLVNLIASTLNALNIIEWFRSSTFIFIWIIILFFMRFGSRIRLDYLLTMFVCSSVFWIVFNLMKLNFSLISVFSNMSRITYDNQNFLLPYPLALSLILLLCYKNNMLKYTLLIFSIIVVIATGYKAHIIIIGLALVYYYVNGKIRYLFMSLLVTFPFIFLFEVIYSYIVIRFQGLGGEGDSLRLREVEVALEIFQKNPIIGSGLGQSFNIGLGWGSESEKSFIHNSVMYILATMGILGLSLILLFFVRVLLKKGPNNIKVILLLLLLSTLSAASYKLIHFNIMLVLLSYILIFYRREKDGLYYTV